MQDQRKHVTPEELSHFIERGLEGCVWGRLEHHLTGCPACLQTLGQILLAPDQNGTPDTFLDDCLMSSRSRSIH